ncbi:MAG: DUF192 domain-containing protein [Xanthomonadaceae bacterium]|nr:DUF192 domain-containing protein [Xanthomonadaceae bacterium]MDP2186569.1 DUF192 domain-containing protein [Xanthomonadales bacterium]MDZ4116248.1 DUF192 domain-containing protein [Xanthomonadaceae bacterium]MDZ4376736.1 DUF192 domain-containing protein [Xanthomonadaceae bacterium]
MSHRLHRLFALAVLALSLNACANADASWVELAGHRFAVEVAVDEASRTRGLMFRDELPANHGMLFVFEREEPLAFWMKNTRIPLDILYFDAERRLVSAAENTPPCSAGNRCPNYPSKGMARFTLELNAGTARQLDIQPGAELVLSPDININP